MRTILEQTDLQNLTDLRKGPFCLPQGKFDSGGLYRLLKSKDGTPHPAACFVWNSYAPKRVQFFIWLLMQRRIQCRSQLLRKKVDDTALCEVCQQHDETADHIIAGCPFARDFWTKLGFNLPHANDIFLNGLHDIQAPPSIPLNISAPSSHFAVGKFGSVGMGSSSGQRLHLYVKLWWPAFRMQTCGECVYLREREQLWMPG